jgi:putative membrane protein
MQHVPGDEVVRVLGQLMCREKADDVLDGGRRHKEQDDAADDFEGAIEALEGDRDPERPVERSVVILHREIVPQRPFAHVAQVTFASVDFLWTGRSSVQEVKVREGASMMHYGYGNGGDHWGLWVLMIVAMVVFWGALAWIIVTLVRQRGTPAGSVPPAPGWSSSLPSSDALRILNERLARGDIDGDEYTRRRSLIEGSG